METLLAGLIITLASFSGALFISMVRQEGGKLTRITTFAGGVIFMTAYMLGIESLHISTLTLTLISIAAGFCLMLIIQKLIPEAHHHHSTDCKHQPQKKHGTKILIGDAVHNIADGIIIAVTFSYSIELGVITSLGILLHEITQEISEFFVLRDAGFSTKKALVFNFLSSLTIFIGILIGTLTSENLIVQAILLSVSAGMFLQIGIHDLFPSQAFFKFKDKENKILIFLFILGILVITATGRISPHSHEHEDDHEEIPGTEVPQHEHTHD